MELILVVFVLLSIPFWAGIIFGHFWEIKYAIPFLFLLNLIVSFLFLRFIAFEFCFDTCIGITPNTIFLAVALFVILGVINMIGLSVSNLIKKT